MDFDKEAREILSHPLIVLLSGSDFARQEIAKALRRAFNAGQVDMRGKAAKTISFYDDATANVILSLPTLSESGKESK